MRVKDCADWSTATRVVKLLLVRNRALLLLNGGQRIVSISTQTKGTLLMPQVCCELVFRVGKYKCY